MWNPSKKSSVTPFFLEEVEREREEDVQNENKIQASEFVSESVPFSLPSQYKSINRHEQ